MATKEFVSHIPVDQRGELEQKPSPFEWEAGKSPKCPFSHQWDFFKPNGKTSEQIEGELRRAIKHMIIFRHEIDGREYGGWELDESLVGKLSLRWLRGVGLLEPVATRIGTDPSAVVAFTWPDRPPSDKPEPKLEYSLPEPEPQLSPDDIDFWIGLRADVEKVPTGTATFRRFLLYFDPQRNPTARIIPEDGKYVYLRRLRLPREVKAIEGYLAESFVPAPDKPEFEQLVQETRELMGRKFKEWWLGEKGMDNLTDPKFWEEFGKDLTLWTRDATFNRFLQHFNPGDGVSEWYVDGKYRQIYPALVEQVQIEKLRGDLDGQDSSVPRTHEIFYTAAPPETRLLLVAKFPDDFRDYAIDALKEQHLLSAEVQLVLKMASLLGADNRDNILSALATYIKARSPQGGELAVSDTDFKKVLEQVSIQLFSQALDENGLARTADIFQDKFGLLSLLEESQADNQKVAIAASGLIEAIGKSYYLPRVRNYLYRRVALFWNRYLVEDRGAAIVPPEVLASFLKKDLQEQALNGDHTEETKKLMVFLQARVLAQVCSHFAEIAAFAPEIAYFRRVDQEGRPKYLFFHQIEGIKELIEKGGGILADEPGTGKTVILALAALNLLDRKQVSPGRPARVLVVGTKSVVDNWESELGLHLQPDGVQVINVNFNKDDVLLNSTDRLQRLARELGDDSHGKQIVMVNYDLFRNPRFRSILNKYPFDVVIVDEMHNVKSRFLASIENRVQYGSSRVAKRTQHLYGYLKGNPQISIFLATSTPFVKELVEPLIMAHLTRPQVVSGGEVKGLMSDPVRTHQILRGVMIRRRKEEIAELPPKEITLIPIDLNLFSQEEREEFVGVAQDVIDETKHRPFSRFYSLLSLEGQAKFPWLISKVQQLIADGRKVVIFTPFVTGEKRNTSTISTVAIAERLYQAGIRSVGILDGSLNEPQRLAVQRDFHKKGGIKVLVGNYLTAGESITLNSPENRATEVILFVSPNVISRFIQSIDRIHRFGQTEKVTVHVPYVTGDILGRSEGTYDERVVNRLTGELATFGAVIDGLFFIEPQDIYQVITQGIDKGEEKVAFRIERPNKELTLESSVASRWRKPTRGPRRSPAEVDDKTAAETEGDYQEDVDVDQPVSFEQVNGGDVSREWLSALGSGVRTRDESLKEATDAFLRRAGQHPILTGEQEQILFEHIGRGSTVEELKHDPRFAVTIEPGDRARFQEVLAESRTVKEVVVNCNLLLVAFVAKGVYGLPLLEKIQEGNIGLMTAVDKFDRSQGTKLSTYAVFWIRRAIQRAVQNTASPIRVPVHMQEAIGKAYGIAREYQQEYGMRIEPEELRRRLLETEGFTEARVNALVRTLQSGVAGPMSSLDQPVGEDGDTVLGDFVPSGEDVEGTVIESTEIREQDSGLTEVFEGLLSLREAEILGLRYGFDGETPHTLEKVGERYGVTRQRIEQIQARAEEKLKGSRWWMARKLGLQDQGRAANTHGTIQGFGDRMLHRPSHSDHLARRVAMGEGGGNGNGSIDPRLKRGIVYQARKQEDVWRQLSNLEKSLLGFLVRRGPQSSLGERLATILGISVDEVAEMTEASFERLERLLEERA